MSRLRQPDSYTRFEEAKLISWPSDIDISIIDLDNHINSSSIDIFKIGRIHSIHWKENIGVHSGGRWDSLNHWTHPIVENNTVVNVDVKAKITSDGNTASYYELPPKAKELQDLISYVNMNAQIGEIFRACYRYGKVAHSDKLRDARKIRFYIEAEIKRLGKL